MWTAILTLALPLLAHGTTPPSTVSHVDGFIGTTYFEDSTELGQTIPQIGVPFAHSPFTPDTTTIEEHCVAPYYYHDEYWKGMRKTHWTSGSCVLDYGSLTVIPSLTLDVHAALAFHSLNHSAETWSPARYTMDLAESGVRVEAVNDNRAGQLRFDLSNLRSDTTSFYVIIMSFDTHYNKSSLTARSSSSVQLSNPVHRFYQGSGRSAGFSGHHSLQFQQKAKSFGIIEGYTEVTPAPERGGSVEGVSDHRGPVAAYFEFDSKEHAEVVLAAGSSFVSRDKAEENMWMELSEMERVRGEGFGSGGKDMKGGNSSAGVSTEGIGSSTGGGVFNLQRVEARVTQQWEDALSVVQVADDAQRADFNPEEGTSNLRQFYSALWHSLLLPRMAADHDGEYMSFGGGAEVIKGQEGDGYWYYDDFSMWDTYRATVPLQFLVVPGIAPDLVQSLVAKSEQGGWLPMFPVWNSYTQEMIGDHCVVVLGDAYQKGLLPLLSQTTKSMKSKGKSSSETQQEEEETALVERVYNAMRRNALEVPSAEEYLMGKGRRAIKEYLEIGFVPLEATMPLTFHSKEQVSRTMEYAYNDYVVAQLALLLGEREEDYEQLLQNSENYRMVIDDAGVGYPRGRHRNLTWDVEEDADFDPDHSYSWLTEASAYQYAWYVPHQVERLIDLYKGGSAFADKLNTFFDGDHYNHGNEPDHQAVFLYAYLQDTPGEGAWRIQDRVRAITAAFYRDGPGGLAGNDDAGQISSWYVLTAMGLYQVCPGCGGWSEYVLTTPLFDSTTLTVQGDNLFSSHSSFTVSARKSSAADIYIQSAQLNGEDYNCAFLPHQVIVRGGSLVYELGPMPNKAWGSSGRSCLDKYFK